MAGLLWLGSARFEFDADAGEVGASLVREQRALLTSAAAAGQRADMRAVNPEWDLMGRMFSVLALVNRALATPQEQASLLAAIDPLIERTMAEQRAHGSPTFLLPYAEVGEFRDRSARSLFVDAEIALMLAARQAVQRHSHYDGELSARITGLAEHMRAAPLLSAESYPDECWTFDNTTALAAMRIYDVLYGADHSELARAWLEHAKRSLLDPETGLLVSSFSYDGTHLNGPEGSSLWFTVHNLLLVDRTFAYAQYAATKEHLARTAFGFGWAREWVREVQQPDIDSGPIIAVLELSAASSGLAFVGAGAFADHDLQRALLRSLRLGAFPEPTEAGLRFAATNQVADAVIAYGLVQGPLWRKVALPPVVR